MHHSQKRKRYEHFHFHSKSCSIQHGNDAVLDEKNSHIRNTRDGTTIELDVNSGVYSTDMWVRLDKTGLVRTVTRSIAVSMLVRLVKLRDTKDTRSNEDDDTNVTEVSGVGEEEDGMAERDGDEDVSGGEMQPPHWRVRRDPRNKANQERRGTGSNACAVLSLVCTLQDEKRSNPSSLDLTIKRCSLYKAHNLHGLRFSEAEVS